MLLFGLQLIMFHFDFGLGCSFVKLQPWLGCKAATKAKVAASQSCNLNQRQDEIWWAVEYKSFQVKFKVTFEITYQFQKRLQLPSYQKKSMICLEVVWHIFFKHDREIVVCLLYFFCYRCYNNFANWCVQKIFSHNSWLIWPPLNSHKTTFEISL